MVAIKTTPAASDALTDLLSRRINTHRYDMGPITHGSPRHTFEKLNLSLGDVLVGSVDGDCRGRAKSGYPGLTLAEAHAIRAEIMRRWNAHAELVAALKGLLTSLQSEGDWTGPNITAARDAIAKAEVAP